MEVIIVAGDRSGDGGAGGPYTGGGSFDTGGYKFQRIRYKTVTVMVVVVILVVKIIAIVIVVADVVALVSFVGLALHQVKQIRDSLSLSLSPFASFFFFEVTGHRENSPGIIIIVIIEKKNSEMGPNGESRRV